MAKTATQTAATGVQLDPELLEAARRVAKEQDRSVASLIRVALRDYIADYELQVNGK